jgi:hypothetical protein
MPDINKDQLLDRILHSGDFTAMEKRYLEQLIERDKQQEQYIPSEYKSDLLNKFNAQR